MDWKIFFEVTHNLAITGSIIAAAWWFISTAKTKQRIQFDIDVSFLESKCMENKTVAEIKCIFENKGFVEHKIYDLAIEIFGIQEKKHSAIKEKKDNDYIFPEIIVKKSCIMPKDQGYYFVRPGVAQTITKIITMPKNITAIRVLAGFTYMKRTGKKVKRGALKKPYSRHNYPHTALRVFPVPKQS